MSRRTKYRCLCLSAKIVCLHFLSENFEWNTKQWKLNDKHERKKWLKKKAKNGGKKNAMRTLTFCAKIANVPIPLKST